MYVSGQVVDDRKLTFKNVFLNLLGAWTDFGGVRWAAYEMCDIVSYMLMFLEVFDISSSPASLHAS